MIPPRSRVHKWHVGLSALLEEQPQDEGDEHGDEDAGIDEIAAQLDSMDVSRLPGLFCIEGFSDHSCLFCNY